MKPGNHCTLYRLVPIPTRQVNVLEDEEEDRSGRKLFLKGRVFFVLLNVLSYLRTLTVIFDEMYVIIVDFLA
ncbi:hypothetical protein BCE02nite_12050 [Brevibacillus centrosporus]|nr:hypothetical protein BCE02nite_12050 [Brevibacillus centrosporus]